MKLLVFDSHPVQYRAPVWQEINRIEPGSLHVVYASDCSVKGYGDKDFAENFSWDIPILEGYDFTILNTEKGEPLSGWSSLGGKGVRKTIRQFKPKAIMLTGLNYKYDMTVAFYAFLFGIPLWLRCETQDQAFKRSKFTDLVRYWIYYFSYKIFNRFFYIGELNKQHYLRHGVPLRKLTAARYATVDKFSDVDEKVKNSIRQNIRLDQNITDDKIVIGFSGKFIDKKDPKIIFLMLNHLPQKLLGKLHLYFVGSGELEAELKTMAAQAEEKYNVKSTFTGFVNQSKIADHYLGMDILILPSKQMGETWGLVANESMQAGCSVIVSNSVGCQADFNTWERFKVFTTGDDKGLANCLIQLSPLVRDFNWATERLKGYSINLIANTIINQTH